MSLSEQTRESCEAAFLELLAEQGYGGVRMGEVAKRAGIARPTLYRYYHNKEEIFRTIIDRLFDQFYDQAEPYLEKFDDSMSLALNTMAIAVAFNHKDIIRSLAESGADEIFVSQLRKYFARMVGGMLRQQGRALADPLELQAVTAMLAGACFHTVRFWLQSDMQHTPAQLARIMSHTFNSRLIELLVRDQSN